MKKACLILFCLTFKVSIGICQNKYPTLDSFEHKYESVWKDIKMPCQWEMTSKRKTNGKLIFFDPDSSGLEFDFIKASSLPFFTSDQTDFETTEYFFDWTNKQHQIKKTIKLLKIEGSAELGFIILKVKDMSGEFYRLLSRHQDFVLSIKIYDRKLNTEQQFEKLKLLYALNKK